MPSKNAWKIELFPWDHESQEHVDRMYDQRVACGWRCEEVPSWIEATRRGERMIYWAVLTEAVPDRANLLETHLREYPKEASPLRDTAQAVHAVPREPSLKEFIPVGHVALEIHSAEEDAKLGLPSERVVWMHILYVSYALQGAGLGSATLDHIEGAAAQAPVNAKLLVLDTIAKEKMADGKLIRDQGFKAPAVPTQVMYERRGYELFLRKPDGYVWKAPSGDLPVDIVYMKKTVG